MVAEEGTGWLSWLQSQSIASNVNDDVIEINCLLLRPRERGIRIVINGLCLIIDKDDIISVTEIEIPENITLQLALPVHLTLRKPVRILSLTSSSLYDDMLFTGQRPFPLVSRVEQVVGPLASIYRQLERAFLRNYGIDRDDFNSNK